MLAGIGAVIGIAAAVGYAALIMYGLRTWWVGAVGTTRLTLHVAPLWLAIGAAGALAAGVLAIWMGVRADEPAVGPIAAEGRGWRRPTPARSTTRLDGAVDRDRACSRSASP